MELHPSNPHENKDAEKERQRKRMSDLAIELSGREETFPFPGINEEVYARIKVRESEFPGFTTDIDTLIERFKNEGMKVVLGIDPESGGAWVLPSLSNGRVNDSIFLKYLQITGITNEALKELIMLQRSWEKMF